jgi:hypothetical protein
MRFDGDVPDDVVLDSLQEMSREVDAVKEWFKHSTKSLDLVKEATERVLTREEASSILRDFVVIGMLAGVMTERNERIMRAAHMEISETLSPEVIQKFEEMLKDSL